MQLLREVCPHRSFQCQSAFETRLLRLLSTARQCPRMPIRSPARCSAGWCRSTDARAVREQLRREAATVPTTLARQNIQTSGTHHARDATAPAPNSRVPAGEDKYLHRPLARQRQAAHLESGSAHRSLPDRPRRAGTCEYTDSSSSRSSITLTSARTSDSSHRSGCIRNNRSARGPYGCRASRKAVGNCAKNAQFRPSSTRSSAPTPKTISWRL